MGIGEVDWNAMIDWLSLMIEIENIINKSWVEDNDEIQLFYSLF